MKLAADSFYSLLAAVVPMAVAIVTVPLYVSIVGQERYGALLIGWLLLGYFGQADFGISRAVTQRISSLGSASGSAIARIASSAMCSALVFSLFSGVLTYAAASYFFADQMKADAGLRAELMAARWSLAMCIPVIAITGVLSGVLMGLERFRAVSMASLAGTVAMQLLPLVGTQFGAGSIADLIALSLAGRILNLLAVAFVAWNAAFKGQSLAPSMADSRALLGYGAWIMITMTISPLMIMADRFVIGAILGAAAVAAYTIPFQVANRTVMFPFAVTQALFPRFANDDADRSLARCKEASAFVGQVYAPMVIGLICLAAPLLKLWLGANLDMQSIAIGQIVLAGLWANAVAGVAYAFIQARGNPRYTALVHVAELPFYMAGLMILGEEFGLAGVAAAFSLRCALDCVIMMRAADVWSADVLLRLAVPLVLVMASIAAGYIFQEWFSAMAAALILSGIAIAVAWLQMPDNIRGQIERLAVLQPVMRFSKRSRGTLADEG